MNRRQTDLKSSNGITMIALVVTIIVLIILAAITLNSIKGENGIILEANEAKLLQEKSEIKESIKLEIFAKKRGNNNRITQSEIEEILEKYGTVNKEGETIESLTPDGKDYEIPFEEIYSGKIEGEGEEVVITGGEYNETKKVNTPKINETEGMKLVTFNETTKDWEEDTTNSDYDYIAGTGTADNTSSKWANAKVTVDGVDSYFVWIPRYAYKITYYTNEDKTTVSSTNTSYGSIDVKFIKGTGTTAADGTICKYAGDTTLTADDYIIHPAFTSNADLGGGFGELEGIWIGKFESSRSDAEIDSVGESTTLKVVPSVKSWGDITIGEMYTYAKAYNTNLKSHMAKNSEWGAVAYLTHSQYGRNGNEIGINECRAYITGAGPRTGENNIYSGTYDYDASNFEATYSYTSEQGKKASTTGNVYGIYDMSGGAYENVASYYNGSSSLTYGSIFAKNGGTSNEYITVYTGTTESSDYIKGDATYETWDWNSDIGTFIWSDYPFFYRSADSWYTYEAGLFSFACSDGDANENDSFRMCLAIK